MKKTIGLIGKKIGMSRVFGEDGNVVPVTVIQAGPCAVLQKKVKETDGYEALQVGFEEQAAHRLNKPQVGHQKKAESGFFRYLKEFRLPSTEGYEVGQKLTVDMFELGDKVSVSGTSKGRGFMGPMRRWNFRGMPASHGHEKVHRSTGSVGQCAWPAKIFKGKKMAGQMGNRKVTCGNLVIVDVIPEDNILLVKGQVPGPNEGVVILRKQA